MACRACIPVPVKQAPIVPNKQQKFVKPREQTVIEEHHYYDNEPRGGNTRYYPTFFEPRNRLPESFYDRGFGGVHGYYDPYDVGYGPYDYYPRSRYMRGARDSYGYDPYDYYGYGDGYGARGYSMRRRGGSYF